MKTGKKIIINLTSSLLLIIMIVFSVSASAECVVLLHGLGRTMQSMQVLEKALTQEGYSVVNEGYPSREYSIEELASLAIEPALKRCPKDIKINFVTHSLGGILVRQYLSEHTIENLNRVVMLAPPNKGSEVIDKLKEIPGFGLINGKAGFQLGTDEKSVPNTLAKPDFDFGVIAGTKSINFILSLLIPNTDDGKVSIESTKLAGMRDHIEIPATHPFIMKNEKVIQQVLYYLKEGSFLKHAQKS